MANVLILGPHPDDQEIGMGGTAARLAEQGHDVDKRQIMLDEPIKQLGVFTVDLRLHREVSTPITVNVVRE